MKKFNLLGPYIFPTSHLLLNVRGECYHLNQGGLFYRHVIMLSVRHASVNDLTAGRFENQKEVLECHVMTGVRYEFQDWVHGLDPKDHSRSVTQ